MLDDGANGRDEAAIFWGEIAPCEHIAQFYEQDAVLLDTLAGFIGGGLNSGESVIIIATMPHLKGLEDRLERLGVNIATAMLQGSYLAMDAEKALSQFMVDQWPDERLFEEFVIKLISRAQQNGRRIRAFGEMVAILWARGDTAATIRLERLWHNLHQRHGFSLLCAYPKTGFTQDPSNSLAEICAAHSRIM